VLRPVIDVRPASPEDLDELVELWTRAREESAQLNHAVHAVPHTALRDRLQALVAGQGEAQILVGRRDGHCAGFVVLRESVVSSVLETRVLLIEHFYVHPQHRRVGLAKAMLGAASAIAERARLEQILCNLLPAPRETHRFFARLGFAPVSVRRVVSTGQLRRRLACDQRRRRIVAIEELAFRRRTLRERYRDRDAERDGLQEDLHQDLHQDLPEVVREVVRDAGCEDEFMPREASGGPRR
jgi:ribosomal protein S18 acetylase RimI-like enzyme